MIKALLWPSFLAGILTFLAPCTFPLLPAYISFITGTSVNELKQPNAQLKKKVLMNAVFYVLGFSIVFVVLGSLFGLGGSALAQYRDFLSMLGGVLITFFGLYLTGLVNIPSFNFERGWKKHVS